MTTFKCVIHKVYLIIVVVTLWSSSPVQTARKYTKEDIIKLREEVREMFNHAYSGYLNYAYPYDELRPLTCDGVDTWGSYSLTLIDALDTLAVMGNYSEFRRVVDIVTSKANFDANINVSVFETNIRIVGGLLSAHLLSQRAGVELEPGWPCNGPLLRLAEDVAKRLLAAFDSTTGMPYGTVNLRHGVPQGETSITCTAGVGTFIVEFGTLSRLTGDPIYEEVAMNALYALYHHRSSIGLYGNHIDVMSGRWTAQDSGIGAGVDSYLEYLVKGALLVQRPELMAIFNEGRVAIDKYLKRNDWYLWVSMYKGQVTLPVFQSLEAYWPGVLSLVGDISGGMKSMHNYHQVWKQYGFTPEFYNIVQSQVGTNRESYPLRPELVESAMYLYRATKDPFLLDVGMDILRSIQHSSRTKCGYATIKDCRDHTLENRMESFFLAETTKYLYLLFDPDNFIHNTGQHGRIHTLPSGRECILDAGGYIFNTEAHPIDPGALLCCSENVNERTRFSQEKSRGEKLTSIIKHNKGQTSPSASQPGKAEDPTLHNMPSAFDKERATNEDEAFLEKLKNSGAVDVVEVPRPSKIEDGARSDGTSSKTLSLNMLQMLETIIDLNLQNKFVKPHWSHKILTELVEVIESAEKLIKLKKLVVKKKDKIEVESNSSEDKKDVSVGYEIKNTNDNTSAEENVSLINDNHLNIFQNESAKNKSINSTSVKVSNKASVKLLKTLSDKQKEVLNNLSDIQHDENSDQHLFKLVINQQFNKIYQQYIKNTILTEAEAILAHVSKCMENLELTKSLVDVTDDQELKSQYYTKRLEVMILATNIKKSILETKKVLYAQKPEDIVSVEIFKKLTQLVVEAKTVKEFLSKHESFMVLAKKLIEIGKEKYISESDGLKETTHDDSTSTLEQELNQIEDIRNNFSNEEPKSGFQSENWKADDISYQVDDTDRVSPVSKMDTGPLFTDKLKLKTEAVTSLLPTSLVSSEVPFDPQVLLERIRDSPKYYRNATWTTQYELLTCLPQPYHTRIMFSGEFYND